MTEKKARRNRARSAEASRGRVVPKAEYLESLIEAVPDGVILFGPDGKLLAVNRGFAELYDVSRTELERLDLDSYRELLRSRSVRGTGARTVEQIGRTFSEPRATKNFVLEISSSRRRFVSVYSAPALDREGRAFGLFALHRDITKESSLLAQAQERADLPDINPIPLFKCDTLGRVLFMNVAAERLLVGLGLTRDKASRMFPGSFTRMIRTAVSDGTGARAMLHHYKGRSLVFTFSPHPRQPHSMVLVEDVTEQREAEQAIRRYAAELEARNRELRETHAALVQSEKMASLGTLVAGVAHEINTPIGSIHSNADVMGRALSKIRQLLDEVSREEPALTRTLGILEEIGRVNETASERIVAIVKSLRNFARLDEAERKSADLHEGLESTLVLVHHEFKNRIEVVRDYDEELPRIVCSPNQLNQVFMNILVNASHAIDGNGTVEVVTRSDGEFVTVSFRDTGRGIEPAIVPKIFDPGFTTKGVGVGTGLGLAICYRIVAEHHGSIAVESEPGRGSTFTITLPIQVESAE